VDVPPWDPVTIALSAAVLLLVAAVAIVVPARRAAVVDPWIELRSE
jgi:ABC-type antimicrobial peptide transport system permease subunit